MDLVWYEKIIVAVWLALFMAGLVSMLVMGLGAEPIDFDFLIEQQAIEAQSDD